MSVQVDVPTLKETNYQSCVASIYNDTARKCNFHTNVLFNNNRRIEVSLCSVLHVSCSMS